MKKKDKSVRDVDDDDDCVAIEGWRDSVPSKKESVLYISGGRPLSLFFHFYPFTSRERAYVDRACFTGGPPGFKTSNSLIVPCVLAL